MTEDLVHLKMAKAYAQIDAGLNGFIVRDDLFTLGNQLLSAFREDISSPKAATLFDGMIAFWAAVATHAGIDPYDEMTPEQFAAGLSAAITDSPTGFDRHFAPMANALIAIADYDADGLIGREEFTAIQVILGTPVAEIAGAFAALDFDRDGLLSTDELLDAWYGFYASSSPGTPANGLFGALEPVNSEAGTC